MVNHKEFTKIDFIENIYKSLKIATEKYFIYKKLKIGESNNSTEDMYNSLKLEALCSGYCQTEQDIYKILIQGEQDIEKPKEETTFAQRLMNYKKCIIKTSGCKTKNKCKEYYEWVFGNYPQFV